MPGGWTFFQMISAKVRVTAASLTITIVFAIGFFYLADDVIRISNSLFWDLAASVIAFAVGFFVVNYLDEHGILHMYKTYDENVKASLECIRDVSGENSSLMRRMMAVKLYVLSTLGRIPLAYVIFNFHSFKRKMGDQPDVALLKGSVKHNSFTSRYVDDGKGDPMDHFTLEDMKRLEKLKGISLTNDPTIWITGLKIDESKIERAVLTVSYATVRYFSKFCLNWHLYCKFRKEEYPIRKIGDQLKRFAEKDFQIFESIPASMGSEVSLITSDNKFVIMQRSHREAVNRFKLVTASSGSYDPDDFEGREGDAGLFAGAYRELHFETGINSDELESMDLALLVHFLSNNNLGFIFVARTRLTEMQIRKRFSDREEGAQEGWETRKFFSLDLRDIQNDTEKLKKFLKKYDRLITDQLLVSLSATRIYLNDSSEKIGIQSPQ